MLDIICLSADDTNLGKVDYASLSTQTLMELLIGDLRMRKKVQNAHGEYKDIQEWEGLTFDDDDGSLYNMYWNNAKADGTIDLKWIPPTLTAFSMMQNELSGTVETKSLPENMHFFNIMGNMFSGSFDISGLPAMISKVYISENEFTGTLDISAMPRRVVTFDASINHFSGTLDFTDLPKDLQYFLVDNNSFSGKLGVFRMPPFMRTVSLNENNFSVEVLHICRPKESERLFIDYRNSGIKECIDEKGEKVQAESTFFVR